MASCAPPASRSSGRCGWSGGATRLDALDRAAAPAEPVLAALATEVIPRGVAGSMLSAMVEGWEALLEQPLDQAALRQHAVARGAELFTASALVLGERFEAAALAGEGWALADLSRNLSDAGLAERARESARERLDAAFGRRWPGRLRALGALAWLARIDLDPAARPPGHPARAWRLLRFRMTGR